MPAPILATKLYIPPPRPRAVSRPRLIERLDEGLAAGRRLTLISAAAGFGKTTLASEWMAALTLAPGPAPAPAARGKHWKVAWLSLDEGDNDPGRFLTYLIAALQTAAPGVGGGTLAALAAPQPPSQEALLTALLDDLAAFPHDLLLVLDDYHAVESPDVDRAVAFLLEYLPPPMHLAIATREDPPLPLARLRARGQLTELRAADLRFTPAEAAEFLNDVMGLNLSAAEVDALEARTEGWIGRALKSLPQAPAFHLGANNESSPLAVAGAPVRVPITDIPTVEYDPAKLPASVRRLRDQIIAAAASGDFSVSSLATW